MAENNRTTTRNIIIFGQTGAGKSSVINMLAGSRVAEVSDHASGCTSFNKRYSISHPGGDNDYTFWDTPGLNEDQEGSVSSQAAVQNLVKLVNDQGDQGVNLLIYCIRGRLVNIIRINYDLFWGIICKEKVPIVLVVTGLEGKHDMDEWWRENEKTIKKMKMVFAGHACITSWKGRENIYEKVYKQSTEKVWELVREHCRPIPWFMPPEWPNKALKEVVEYMIHKVGAKSWISPIHNIILFGEAGAGKSSLVNLIVGRPVAKVSSCGEGCTFKNEAYEAIIGDTTFNIYDTAGLDEGDQGRVPHWEAIRGLYTLIRQLSGVSLLIYCMRGRVRENATFNWILFNKVICGEKVPIVAVVTGLETYDDPDHWWRAGDNRNAFKKNGMRPKDVACVVSFPGRQNELADIYSKSQGKVRSLVTKHYLRQPWSEEKDEWFANIYKTVFTTKLCFSFRNRLDYSAIMRNLIFNLIKVTKMEEEDAEKLRAALLNAEKNFRKRGD